MFFDPYLLLPIPPSQPNRKHPKDRTSFSTAHCQHEGRVRNTNLSNEGTHEQMKSYTSPQLLSLPSRSDLACPSLRTPTCPPPRLSMPPAAALTRALQQAPGHFPLVHSLSHMTAHLKMGGPSEMTGGWRSVPVTAAFCLRSQVCLPLLPNSDFQAPFKFSLSPV